MKITGDNLSIFDVYNVAYGDEVIELDQEQLAKVAATYERTQEWGAEMHPIYGVNTGFGEMTHIIVPAQFKSELQANLLRSHAAGGGEPFADEIVRAIMLARLNCFMRGYSGVSPHAVHLLTEFLNRRIHPLILQQGSLGASGDLAPLSHIGLTLMGEGYVSVDGKLCPSGEVMEEAGLKPLILGYKEALALANGTSAMTGGACIALVKAHHLLKLAVLATSSFVQCLQGSTRPFDDRGHVLKNHTGQVTIARVLRELLSGSGLTREHSDIMKAITQETSQSEKVVDTNVYLQDAYTLRCVPQILGPVLDTLGMCQKMVEEELNSCNDNPLIFETPEAIFHGGNFHGQYVAMYSDFLNIALTEIGVLAERQLNRLVDPHLNNNLPPFLAHGGAGLFCGFAGVQYLATSIASENLDLAAPASVKSIPSNGGNQDVVSMGLIAVRKSLRLCENVGTILSVLFAACYQSSHFLEQDLFSQPVRQLYQRLSQVISLYHDDIPMYQYIEQVRALVLSEGERASLEKQITLAQADAAAV